MKRPGHALGKIGYGFLFVLVLPVLLWVWALYTEPIVSYPAVQAPLAGLLLLSGGTALSVWGMFALIVWGKGLPMNAYPPRRLVQRGPYRLLRHPIYWGFGLVLLGASLFSGSASGLWLITPLTILCMIALVLGYENLDLAKRFPGNRRPTMLGLPEGSEATPSPRDRFAGICWLMLGYPLLQGVLLLKGGGNWPQPGSPTLFLLGHLAVVGAPLLVQRRAVLRRWMVGIALTMGGYAYLALLGQAFARSGDPLFSGFWTGGAGDWNLTGMPLFALMITAYAYSKTFPKLTPFFWLASAALVIPEWKVGILLDAPLVAQVFLYILGVYYAQIWSGFRKISQDIANSWKEWVWGPVRVINHGFYAGLGAFWGLLMAGWMAGRGYAWGLLGFGGIVLIVAALWAQVIEGGEKLKRPFGYYGSMVGIAVAALLLWWHGFDIWVMIGVTAALSPWVQAVGRLRCLVNGCCHGSPTHDPAIGIRYFHPRSRVCGLSDLCGVRLHPTPLYAILWLTLTGFVLLALWHNRLPPSFLMGLYLILAGIGRFVEEAYRGEVQTPIIRGLRLYQWTAIASVILGIGLSMVPSGWPELAPGEPLSIIGSAVAGGLITTFAMGVDFPNSNAPFSRLV